ncbi:hypothetical protein GCM10010913_44260 [Paenibacillus aceti]|uniref:Uncharacterized protein n=1 Tax=Paenibacillus aceti TaxID=1820010 RepID=A0ABQ1W7J6_9BACL|nr:hypothetical protein GCM10010913_44260 [Paenibacillus aceti]
MTKSDNEENNKTQEEISSFNSVTDHYRNIMGVPTQKIDMEKMPLILRYSDPETPQIVCCSRPTVGIEAPAGSNEFQ